LTAWYDEQPAITTGRKLAAGAREGDFDFWCARGPLIRRGGDAAPQRQLVDHFFGLALTDEANVQILQAALR